MAETLHLATGSPLPVKQDGLLRLYSMKFCPYAERVRIVLKAKNIPHDTVNVSLKQKPEWLFELNPLGQVPVLDTGDQVLAQSLAISDYLDERYPDPPLYPEELNAKAEDVKLVKRFDDLIGLYYKIARSPKEKTLSEYAELVSPLLREFEAELGKRGNYFGGEEPKMVDYMIWPWAERADVLELALGEKLPIPEDEIKRLRSWCARMRTLEPVKATVTSTDRLYKIMTLHSGTGPLDYDSI